MSRAYRGVPLDQIPEILCEFYRRHPERTGRTAGGTLVALSHAADQEPASLAYQQRGAGIVSQDQNRGTWGRLNMEQHAAMTGTHSHPVTHAHAGDNSHAWAQKGEAAWAKHRETWAQDAAQDRSGVQRGPSGEAVGHREVVRWSRTSEEQALALAAEDEGSHVAVSGGHAHGHRHAGGAGHGHYHWHYRDGDQPGDHHAHEHDADDLGAEVAETEGVPMSYPDDGYPDDGSYVADGLWADPPDPEMAEREFGLTARERDQGRMRTLFADPDFSIRDAIKEFASTHGMRVDQALELCAEAAEVGSEYDEAPEDWQLAEGLYRLMGNDPAVLDGDPAAAAMTADAEAHAVLMLAGRGDYHQSPFAIGGAAEDAHRRDMDIPEVAVEHYSKMHEKAVNGPPRPKRYHGKTGSSRPVRSNQRAHAREVQEDATDHEHPAKGGSFDRRVKGGIYSGMAGPQGTMGGPEAILAAHGYGVRGR